jgi:hypothetical protein
MGRLIKSPGIAAAVAGLSLALLLPAQAQFWDWGGRPQRPPAGIGGGWGGGWGGGGGGGGGWGSYEPRQAPQAPADYSRAPAPSHRKPEASSTILVLGDANADWLAYGLEEAFADKPEIGIVRKHRTESGLIRYDSRRDSEWAQVARDLIAAEKPKFIVMMIGNFDRQQIRERAPAAARPGAPKAAQQQGQPASAPPPAPAIDPEQQPPAAAEAPEPPPAANLSPEQARQAAFGPWEFHSEKWEAAYIRRIDATIAALKSGGAPVIWVGLPSQRGPKASADSAYLNDIYRSRAERAGIVFVDIWDGFVDEAGRFSPQGPDYEGQIRRLRTADGVYFTRFGARKLAHYVEREIQRYITNRGLPVALPVPDTVPVAPGGKQGRPAIGPVVPLTSAKVVQEELVGAPRTPARAPAGETATRVLTKGETLTPQAGRADDFSWPRASAAIEPAVADPAAAAAAAGAATPANSGAAAPKAAARPPQAGSSAAPRRARPEAPRQLFPFQGFFRF